MQITGIPFSTTDWTTIEAVIHDGVKGEASWKTQYINDIRIRLVVYSAGYEADHWCSKGHIIYCVEGEMETELEDGRIYVLKKGMMYTVGDNSDAHKSISENGCTLFIVD
jgi:quercetin dioxygenase-like cupin family protein